MLNFLERAARRRKVRLFACACARDLLAHNPAAHPHEHWGGKGALTDRTTESVGSLALPGCLTVAGD